MVENKGREEETAVWDFLDRYHATPKHELCAFLRTITKDTQLVERISNIIENNHASEVCDSVCEVLFQLVSLSCEDATTTATATTTTTAATTTTTTTVTTTATATAMPMTQVRAYFNLIDCPSPLVIFHNVEINPLSFLTVLNVKCEDKLSGISRS